MKLKWTREKDAAGYSAVTYEGRDVRVIPLVTSIRLSTDGSSQRGRARGWCAEARRDDGEWESLAQGSCETMKRFLEARVSSDTLDELFDQE